MKKTYVPQSLRQLNQKQTVKMPKRENLRHDKELLSYYRETLLMLIDLVVDTTENILDFDIDMMERIHLQNIQNKMFQLNEGVKKQLPEKLNEKHETRVDFVTEMINLCTLVEPKYFDNVQSEMVKKIKKLHKLK
jgi:hypothetical protein